MTLLDKNAILQADDLVIEDVQVPEWKGVVRVRAMSGLERDAMGAMVAKDGNGGDGKVDQTAFRSIVLAHTIVGEDGALLFDRSDLDALGRKNGAVLDRLFRVADRLNGITSESLEAAKGN